MSQERLHRERIGQALQTAVQQLQRVPPEKALMEFVAETEWVQDFLSRTSIRNFEVVVDEPESLGGSNAGPNPMELLLAALGTCQVILFAAYATFLQVPLEGLRVRVSGRLDPRGFFGVAEVPCGYQAVNYEIHLEGPAEAEQVRQLAELAESRCPVLDTLQRPIPVQGRVFLRGQPVG